MLALQNGLCPIQEATGVDEHLSYLPRYRMYAHMPSITMTDTCNTRQLCSCYEPRALSMIVLGINVAVRYSGHAFFARGCGDSWCKNER